MQDPSLEDLDFLEDEYEIDETNDSVEPMGRPVHSNQLNAWTSLILGIVGSLGWIIPIIGLPVTIVGTVLGAIGMKSKRAKGIAIAGFVVNTTFLVGSVAKGIIDIIRYLKRSGKF